MLPAAKCPQLATKPPLSFPALLLTCSPRPFISLFTLPFIPFCPEASVTSNHSAFLLRFWSCPEDSRWSGVMKYFKLSITTPQVQSYKQKRGEGIDLSSMELDDWSQWSTKTKSKSLVKPLSLTAASLSYKSVPDSPLYSTCLRMLLCFNLSNVY